LTSPALVIVGAWGSEIWTGKSYVVFGKANSSAINLSAIVTHNQIIQAIAVDIACAGD
jgi:hypothetical protein